MKRIGYIIAAVLLILAGQLLLQEDYTAFLKWWVTVAALGIVFLPVTTLLFANFHDKGYLFSKVIGIAVAGYIAWLASSLHILKFTEASVIIAVTIGLILNAAVMLWQRKRNQGLKAQDNVQAGIGSSTLFQGKILNAILSEELLFFAIFLLFTYVRCFKPEAYGTEKFMDYGFMTSMMRSEYMPPQDFWFSGTKLNYYYVGQYLAVFLTKLSFSRIEDAYNLMLMMVGAFTVVLPYSIVYNVTLQFVNRQERKHRILPQLSGILAGLGVCIAGNMHYPFFQWLKPNFQRLLGMDAEEVKYWFPDATRFIGYNPDTADKTIHEFPAYSFVLGDLHAHVVNIMFVLTVLGLLFAWLSTRKEADDNKPSVLHEVFHPAILGVAFFIGLFHTTNFWDFPIYYVVAGAIILFSNLIVYNFSGKALWLTALQGILVYGVSELVCLPFTLNFDQISTSICLAVNQTPLYQLMILWGLPIYVILCFLISLVSNHKIEPVKAEQKIQKKLLSGFMKGLTASDLYILVLGLCAIGLVLLPEVIYVQDIYSGDYKRANTMFKLTYQAFIMFGLCFGYILLRLLCYGRTIRQKWTAGLGLLLFLLSLSYIQVAVNSWYGNIFDRSGYKGLDAAAFMETQMPKDSPAIDWLNENITGTPVVLEANGDSYTDYERVSVMTGLPTVMGWHTHEWLWKSDTVLLDERSADIQTIYTASDAGEVRRLLEKYQVSYIFVGKLEREKYITVNHELLKSLGEVVYEDPEASGEATYIVKVNY